MSFRCWGVNRIVFIPPPHHPHDSNHQGAPPPVSFGNCRKYWNVETITSLTRSWEPEAISIVNAASGQGPGRSTMTDPNAPRRPRSAAAPEEAAATRDDP